MRLLVITNMWPSDEKPYLGAFLADHLAVLREKAELEVKYLPTTQNRWKYFAFTMPVEKRPDVIIVHHSLLVPLGLLIARRWRPRPRVMAYVHEGELSFKTGLKSALQRTLANMADGRVSVTPALLGFLRKPVEVIPIGVNLDRFDLWTKQDARRQLGFSKDATILFFPGDPARPEKRFDLCQDAVRILRGENLSLELVIGGAIAYDHMPLYYSACDAVLLSSDYEASSTAIKESIASNRPIVTTRTGDAELYGTNPLVVVSASTEQGIAAGIRHALTFQGQPTTRQSLDRIDNRVLTGNFVSFLESLCA